jgi:recombination protein RecT
MAQQIAQKPAPSLRAFNDLMGQEKTREYLKKVLGKKAQAFVNNITALVANSALLQGCEPTTLMFAGIKATALDLPLDPNLGFAYVLPYNNRQKGIQEAQFQMGYKGFIQLAIRSGLFQTINVTDVREGEIVEQDLLSGSLKLKAVENREEAKVVGFAAFFRLTNGFEKSLYMTVEQLEKHAEKYSKTYAYQNSVWRLNFEAMAKKTVLKLLLSKFAPLSVEMQTATQIDQSVITADSIEYVDNDNQTTALNEATLDADLLKFALEDINNAPDLEALDDIEQRQKNFWGNETFKAALAEKKASLSAQN